MTFKELLNKVDFDDVWYFYIKNFFRNDICAFRDSSGEDITSDRLLRMKEAVRKMFDNLIAMEPKINDTNSEITIIPFVVYEGEFETQKITKTANEDVSVYEGGEEFFSMMFIDWARIIGMNISDICFENRSEAQAAAIILWEVSFFGTEETDMQKERDVLEETVEDCKRHPNSGKSFSSIDELMKELGFTDERSKEEKAFDEELYKRELEENESIRKEYHDRIMKAYHERYKV